MNDVRNKEEFMGGRALSRASKFDDSRHVKNFSHLESDEKWNGLSKKEKMFCTELNMKPTSYCTLKR